MHRIRGSCPGVDNNRAARYRLDNLLQQRIEVTPVTVALSPKEIKVIKCNGVGSCKKKKHMYTLPPDYLSHIVVIGNWTSL